MKYLASIVGALEWYDTAIVIGFADIISKLFIPEASTAIRYTYYFFIFFISYLCRPVGALLFGWYSDKYSRMISSTLALFCMIISSLFISLLPTYDSIGYYASGIFIFCRIVQGVAIGGNYGTSVFSVEAASSSKKYFVSSFVSWSIMVGFCLGTLITKLFTLYMDPTFLVNYGWRLALWIGFLSGIPTLAYLFSKIKDYEKKLFVKSDNFSFSVSTFFKMLGLISLDMIPFYTFFTFLPSYHIMLRGTGFNWNYILIAYLEMLVLIPILGMLADKVGGKIMLMAACIGLIGVSFISPWDNYFSYICIGITMSFCYSSLYGIVAVAFSEEVRARASGLALNVGSVVFGGSSVLIDKYLVGNNFYLLSCLLMGVGVIVLLILMLQEFDL